MRIGTFAAITAIGCIGLIAACSGDDDGTKSSSGSTSSSSSGGSSGATSSSSSSGGSTSSSGGSSGSTTQSLYDRLGKKAGIAAAVSEVVKAELADPEIASYFLFVGKPGHPPSAAVIEECLVNQLGAAAGGPSSEVMYPTTVMGFTCRDMKTTHAGLGIPPGTFDKFVTIAAGKLKELGVADADITTIGGVLNGTKADVVTDDTRQSGPFNKDAGM
jgi:hypothetical protein